MKINGKHYRTIWLSDDGWSVEIIDRLEQRTGKPVITSNQALAWDALRLAGIDDPVTGFGRLLSDRFWSVFALLHPLR